MNITFFERVGESVKTYGLAHWTYLAVGAGFLALGLFIGSHL